MNAAMLTAMFNRINPAGNINAGNIKNPPGFPAPGPSNYYPYDPIYGGMPYSGPSYAEIQTNLVPEPSGFVLAACGIVLAAASRLRSVARSTRRRRA